MGKQMSDATILETPRLVLTMWDKGDADPNMKMGMAMDGDMSKAVMGIAVDRRTAKAGEVTFKVTNVSKETVHEMIVSPVKDDRTKLPYLANENRVDEDAAGHLGEVSELDPGATGSLTLNLKPGLYILFCNVPGHFVSGMWTTVQLK